MLRKLLLCLPVLFGLFCCPVKAEASFYEGQHYKGYVFRGGLFHRGQYQYTHEYIKKSYCDHCGYTQYYYEDKFYPYDPPVKAPPIAYTPAWRDEYVKYLRDKAEAGEFRAAIQALGPTFDYGVYSGQNNPFLNAYGTAGATSYAYIKTKEYETSGVNLDLAFQRANQLADKLITTTGGITGDMLGLVGAEASARNENTKNLIVRDIVFAMMQGKPTVKINEKEFRLERDEKGGLLKIEPLDPPMTIAANAITAHDVLKNHCAGCHSGDAAKKNNFDISGWAKLELKAQKKIIRERLLVDEDDPKHMPKGKHSLAPEDVAKLQKK